MDISIVIGFKDWGLDRLLLSIRSLHAALNGVEGEIIVSDFGSSTFDDGELQRVVSDAGARYVRTDTDGTWSRSRAINAGWAVSQGETLVATDADMLFSPESMAIVHRTVQEDPGWAVVLQCRDLPQGYDAEYLQNNTWNMEELFRVSQIRPRWGMGGMFAAHRDVIRAVGGYDCRMHTYGGEDLDLAGRVRRRGARIHWIEHPQVRMFHIWHPATISTVEATASGREAIAANRSILFNDLTWKRNTGDSTWEQQSAEWAAPAWQVGKPGEILQAEAEYTLLVPEGIVLRDDAFDILARHLNVEQRAIVASVAVLDESQNVVHVLPAVALESQLLPVVRPFSGLVDLDVVGAIFALKNSGVDLGLADDAIGIVPLDLTESANLNVSVIENALLAGLMPSTPDESQVTALVEHLPLSSLVEDDALVDVEFSATATSDAEGISELRKITDHWCEVKNLLTDESTITAVFFDTDKEMRAEIDEYASVVGGTTSILSSSRATAEVEELDSLEIVSGLIERTLQEQKDPTSEVNAGAVEIAWTHILLDEDAESLTDSMALQGETYVIKTARQSLSLWIAASPAVDISGPASPADVSFGPGWCRGIAGTLPAIAMINPYREHQP